MEALPWSQLHRWLLLAWGMLLTIDVATAKPRLFDDNDIMGSPGQKPKKRKLLPIVKDFLKSKLNSSGSRLENNYTAHHELVQQHCAKHGKGCTWNEYYAVLDEVRKPFLEWKDAGALPVSIDAFQGEETVTTCDRLHKPSRKEFLEQVLSRRPAVITGVVSKWPAKKKWTWSYLLEKLGDHKVKVSVNPTPFFDGPEKASKWNITDKEFVVIRPGFMEIKFQEFYNLLRSKFAQEAYYYLQYFPMKSMKDLSKDLGDLTFAEWLQTRFYLIWFGDGRTGGHLHFDSQENLMAMVSGAKTFLLYDPKDGEALYAGKDMPEAHLMYGFDHSGNHQFIRDKRNVVNGGDNNHYSPINPDKPDYKKYPLSKGIKPIVCRVNAGEVLYNPSHFWHHVKSHPDDEGKSIGVNIFTEPLFNRYGSTDPYYLSNRYYSHIHDFGDTRPGHTPRARAKVKGKLVEFPGTKKEIGRSEL